MTDRVREWLADVPGEMPVEIPGHEISITLRGSTCRIRCECGKRLGGGKGCNRSGVGYAVCAAKDAYRVHLAQISR